MRTVKISRSKFLLVLLLVFGASCYAQSQKDKPRSEALPKIPKNSAENSNSVKQPTARAANPIAQAAAQKGVVKCAERINQFSNFLTGGTQSGGQLFVAPSMPDRLLVTTSLEIQSGQAISYAGASYAPDGEANHCGAVYEAVTYWQNSCDEVAKGAFNAFKAAGPLRQTIRTLEGGPTVRVFLLPAGMGCVSIKKEIAY